MLFMCWDCDFIDLGDFSLRLLLFRETWFGAFGGTFVHGTFAVGFVLFPCCFFVFLVLS